MILACRVKLIRCRFAAPKEIFISKSEPDYDLSVTILTCRVTILGCRMKLIRCPFAAPKEVFASRSEPAYYLSVMILACRVTILACRVTILACRMTQCTARFDLLQFRECPLDWKTLRLQKHVLTRLWRGKYFYK
jgi:hypothetical protein